MVVPKSTKKEENQCINEMRSDLEDDTRNSNGKVIVGLFCCELVQNHKY